MSKLCYHRYSPIAAVNGKWKKKKLLEKVWVSVYDSHLADEQVCRLAAMHNLNNQGCKQTKWTDRVVACRQWLYKLADADIDRDDTPESSKEWKKACQSMYTATGKVPLFKEILSPDIQVHFLKESSRHPISTSIISFHWGINFFKAVWKLENFFSWAQLLYKEPNKTEGFAFLK